MNPSIVGFGNAVKPPIGSDIVPLFRSAVGGQITRAERIDKKIRRERER